MYCVIQFYVQLRLDLASHRPFLKVLAIKLVIFLSFWQTALISVLTSTLKVVSPTAKLAYPDLKVGIPSLLLCLEMAIFSILHQFAFPWKPYSKGSEVSKYPGNPIDPMDPSVNDIGPKQGGLLGWRAIADAMNPWDLVKGFGRGMKWLFVGVKHREKDSSYKNTGVTTPANENDLVLGSTGSPGHRHKPTAELPIASQFRRSKFGMPPLEAEDEGVGLIANAQGNPSTPGSGYVPARQRYDSNGQDISSGGTRYDIPYERSPDRLLGQNPTPGTVRRQEQRTQPGVGMAMTGDPEPYESHIVQPPYIAQSAAETYLDHERAERRQKPSEQWANSSQRMRPSDNDAPPQVHNALWGPSRNPRDDGRI